MKLVYELTTQGIDNVKQAMRSVEREAVASDKRMAASRTRASKGSGGAADPTYGPGRKEQLASIRQRERTEIQAAARVSRERASAARAEERQRVTSVRREERARIQSDKASARARDSLDRQRSSGLMQQARAAERAEARLIGARRATAQRMSSGVARSVGGAIGGVAKVGGAALGIAGGFAAADALKEQFSIRRKASELANQAGTPGEKDKLAKESLGVQGFTGSETLGAMSEFVTKTGDLTAARAAIQDLGKLALATSTDFGELGGAAGQAFNVIRDTITDPKKQIEALQDVMRSLAAQGALGAVEIKDMVTELAGLGAATRKFEGGPVTLLKTMGAMAQASVARGGSSSAAEGTTAVTRFSDDIIKNTDNVFGKAGINRFSDKSHTKLRGPEDIMLDVLDKTGGDLGKVSDMFGVYAQRAVGGFAPLYTEAEKKKKGSGRAAVKAEFSKFRDATVSDKDINARAASRMADPDLQLKEAAKTFNDAVGRELGPVAIRLAQEFTKLIPYAASLARIFAKFIGFFAENPVMGIGALIGGALVKDIASAGISSILKSAVEGAANYAMKKGGGTLDPETGELKPGGKMAAAGTGVALGLAVATFIVTTGIMNIEKSESNMNAEGAKLTAVRASTDPEFIRKSVEEQRKRVNTLKAPGFVGSVLGDGAQSAVDFAVDPNKKTEVATAEANLAEMEAKLAAAEAQKAAAAKLDAAADKLAKAADGMPKGGKEPSRNVPMSDPKRG